MDTAMRENGAMRRIGFLLGLTCLILPPAPCRAAARHVVPHVAPCQRIVLAGDVSAGNSWQADIGQGWTFRVLPIAAGRKDYSGWDLVVDRTQPAGYPDALLLATPPYNSINEREIGTTYGLRAQDAIGWNPRSFRFLTDPAALREGQRLFRQLSASGPAQTAVASRLLALANHAAAGQFRILDARLIPGVADPAPYAQNWALEYERTQHSVESNMGNPATPRGQLFWMRFSVTLWLPQGWRAPRTLHATTAPCAE